MDVTDFLEEALANSHNFEEYITKGMWDEYTGGIPTGSQWAWLLQTSFLERHLND